VAISAQSSIIHGVLQAAIPAVGFVWSDFETYRQATHPAQFEIGFVWSIVHVTDQPAYSAYFEIGFDWQNLVVCRSHVTVPSLIAACRLSSLGAQTIALPHFICKKPDKTCINFRRFFGLLEADLRHIEL
jgi:hypothetical protein